MPQKLGKPLIGKYKGLYRYRYGNYRILYEIDLANSLVIINKIGHRSNIY
jgi:mRNA interferase RelE/StbE